MGSGYDKIDVKTATKKGIAVMCVYGDSTHEVAEHAATLMLATARKLEIMTNSMHTGTWMSQRKYNTFTRLNGKSLGIVGFGRIGREIGRIAKGIGMEVIAYDNYEHSKVDYQVRWANFRELLEISDVVSVNCPLTPETRDMFGCEQFKIMKNTAIFINVARGAICNEQALADALRTKEIAFAGIDVHEHTDVFAEPKKKPYEGIYAGLDNILLTPHYASFSEEAWRDCVTESIRQMKDAINGRIPENCINKDVFQRGRKK
jgi:D-3-phosphoglycerate dehydrogenase